MVIQDPSLGFYFWFYDLQMSWTMVYSKDDNFVFMVFMILLSWDLDAQ
jgi:hypothetical protein